jgi:hypothetical protein
LSDNRVQEQGSWKKAKLSDAPSLISQTCETVVLFAALFFLSNTIASSASPGWFSATMYSTVQTVYSTSESVIKPCFGILVSSDWYLLFQNIFKPSNWWDTAGVDWDGILCAEFCLLLFTMAMFVVDLLVCEEKHRGNWIILAPSVLMYTFAYVATSIHAQSTHLVDPEVYLSFEAAQIGEKLFTKPQIVIMMFSNIFALDLTVSFFMMQDFYRRTTSRPFVNRLIMAFVVLTHMQGLLSIPIYLVLRVTLFAGPDIHDANTTAGRNFAQQQKENLMDDIPQGAGALNGWVRKIPAPYRIPASIIMVAVGIFKFTLMLGLYLIYVVFICLPVSTIFFSWRRAVKIALGAHVEGAIYLPFETVGDKAFPFKAVLVVSAHLRLICFKNNNNRAFNLFVGWWLRKLLEAFVMYEFAVPFKRNFAPYVGFLMEEFGLVFPLGDGLGFGTYEDVKAIIENPDQRKSGLSLAWSISTSQRAWSDNNLTSLPETDIDKSIVEEGRDLVRCWLKDVKNKLACDKTRESLNTILPYAPVDGTMIEKKLLETAFGSTLFHLLTDGDFTEHERHRYHKLVTNAFPFMSDWINSVWFGGILESSGIQDYGTTDNHVTSPHMMYQNPYMLTLCLLSNRHHAKSLPSILGCPGATEGL